MSVVKLVFNESLEFEDMGIEIELGKHYNVLYEIDGVAYIKDDKSDVIGFQLEGLDSTVNVIKDGEL